MTSECELEKIRAIRDYEIHRNKYTPMSSASKFDYSQPASFGSVRRENILPFKILGVCSDVVILHYTVRTSGQKISKQIPSATGAVLNGMLWQKFCSRNQNATVYLVNLAAALMLCMKWTSQMKRQAQIIIAKNKYLIWGMVAVNCKPIHFQSWLKTF